VSGRLRIGCQLGPFKGLPEFLDTIRRIEALGFDVATFPDHFGRWAGVWPAIAAAAAVTRTLRLGALTFNNDLWNPVLLARDAATADLLSDGRLELGIGAGWRNADYTITGIRKDSASDRIVRLAESVRLLHRYWQPGEFEVAGRFYSARVPSDRLLPAQTGGIPIFIGGGGRQILGVAASLADTIGVHINLKGGEFKIGTGAADLEQGVVQDAFEERLAWIRSSPRERPEPPELHVFFMEVRGGKTSQEAAATVGPTFGVSEEDVLASPYFLTGPPEEMARKLRGIHTRHGISYFTVREDHMDVMTPVLRALETVGRSEAPVA
jgi:probable F420-dependent oxidoreductase